jgi:hypothetical protein
MYTPNGLEGNKSVRYDVPISLKNMFDEKCKANGKTMTEVLIDLMASYVNGCYDVIVLKKEGDN